MTTRVLLTLAVMGLLSACSEKPAPSPATEAAPAPAAPQPAPDQPQAPLPGPAAVESQVPEDVIVSTNEPFWQARVEGQTLVLTSPEGERRLDVQSNQPDGEGRRIVARDAKGSVEATITAAACEDDMSGLPFPLTGTLSFDGGPVVRGCARGASTPQPREGN